MAIHLQYGQKAEKRALRFLKRQGLILLQKNFRCYYGEIDLIMQDNDTIAFVEVRYRSNPHYGNALESITHSKQCHLQQSAQYYLSTTKAYRHASGRFDVIGIDAQNKIDWIKNAFEVEYDI